MGYVKSASNPMNNFVLFVNFVANCFFQVQRGQDAFQAAAAFFFFSAVAGR